MKKLKLITVLLACSLLLTGCFKRDTMDGISIYTTTYPLEYLVESIYGSNSTIDSIYPNGVDKANYKLTTKQVKEYANSDMFIYNGLTDEKQIAANFLNNNKNLKVIDVTKGLSLQNGEEELWLCPSNYLMLAQNIKKELIEYVTAQVVKDEIETNYENLKLTISKYDANLKLIAENANNKTIIVGNDVFNFLTKYGFNVISVEQSDNYTAKKLSEAKSAITSKNNDYVFILDKDEKSENVETLEKAGATIVTVKTATILSDEEKSEDYSYTDMMKDFIDEITEEAYN